MLHAVPLRKKKKHGRICILVYDGKTFVMIPMKSLSTDGQIGKLTNGRDLISDVQTGGRTDVSNAFLEI